MSPKELEAAIEALPEPQRSAMRMRVFERSARTDIAERLGLDETHVERLLVRSRIAIAEAAQPEEPRRPSRFIRGRTRHA